MKSRSLDKLIKARNVIGIIGVIIIICCTLLTIRVIQHRYDMAYARYLYEYETRVQQYEDMDLQLKRFITWSDAVEMRAKEMIREDIESGKIKDPSSSILQILLLGTFLPLLFIITYVLLVYQSRRLKFTLRKKAVEVISRDSEHGTEFKQKQIQLIKLLESNVFNQAEYNKKVDALIKQYQSNIGEREKLLLNEDKLVALKEALENGLLSKEEYTAKLASIKNV